MPTISASKPVLPLSPKGLPVQRTVRFAGGETPEVPAQGATEQADQTEVKAPPLTKAEKEEIEKTLTIYEKLSPGFMTRVGQRFQAFFKGLWNSIRQLFINKTNFALEKTLNEMKDIQVKVYSNDKFKKLTQVAEVKINQDKETLDTVIKNAEIESTLKERAQKILKEIEEREKSGQTKTYGAAALTARLKHHIEEEVKEAEN